MSLDSVKTRIVRMFAIYLKKKVGIYIVYKSIKLNKNYSLILYYYNFNNNIYYFYILFTYVNLQMKRNYILQMKINSLKFDYLIYLILKV